MKNSLWWRGFSRRIIHSYDRLQDDSNPTAFLKMRWAVYCEGHGHLKKTRATPKPDMPTAVFDFNAAARKAAKDHPELQKTTAFIDARTNDWVARDALIEKLIDEDEMDTIESVVKGAKRLKTSFTQAVNIGKNKDAHALVFHPDKNPLFAPIKGAVDDFGSFDHETGHILAPDLHGTLGENAADAYAMLRHVQRFGTGNPDADYCGWKRALVFALTGISSHLTTFTVDKIVLDSKSADFMSLTPKETAAIARDYALKNTPDAKALKKLQAAFAPVKGGKPTAETFRCIAAITLAAKADSDVFALGARILQKPLEDKIVTFNGKKISLHGNEWSAVQQKLQGKLAMRRA